MGLFAVLMNAEGYLMTGMAGTVVTLHAIMWIRVHLRYPMEGTQLGHYYQRRRCLHGKEHVSEFERKTSVAKVTSKIF